MKRPFLCCFLSLSLLGAHLTFPVSGVAEDAPEPPASQNETPAVPLRPEKILRLTIRGPVFESQPPLSIFGGSMGTTLQDLVGTVRRAAKDPETHALILRLKTPGLGWTQLQALRRELIRFRKTGKPSYCHLDYAVGRTYLLASACSEVSLLPTGAIEIPGVSLGRMYMKGLLDKIGIEFQELRMGRYKSAVESFTRTEPSDAVREESQAILDDLFDEYLDAIAENRSLQPVVARSLVDTAVFLPEDARAAGLVDRVEYRDEFLRRIAAGETAPRQIVNAKLGKGLKLEVGGFAGMMSLINEIFGGPRKRRASTAPKIAVVHGIGAIVQSAGQASLFGGSLMSSDQMVKLFRRVREDDSVKAVVFRVDSPGGSALASDLIWREVMLTTARKPVVVSMGDMAASGGYYVSCPASWIVAERGTLTGSIGVIGAVPDMRRLHEKVGVTYEVFSRGKRAGVISPYGELTGEGRELLLKQMRKIYDDFLGKVAEGRGLAKNVAASVAEGRVWTGRRALKHGLVDELGGLDEALARARKLGKVPEDAEILSLPRPKSLFEVLSEMEGGVSMRALASSLPRQARSFLKHLEWIRTLERERVLTVLPAVISVLCD